MQKGFAPILLLVGILVLVVIAGGVYYFGKSQAPKSQNQIVSQTPQPTTNVSSPSSFKFTNQSQGDAYQVFGWFTREASQKEMDSVKTTLGGNATSVGIMESFPPQFQIVSPDQVSCEKVRKILPTLKFIQSFGDCRKVEYSPNPDQSVNSNQ